MTFFHGQEKLEGFLDNFTKSHPNLRFTHAYSGKSATFLDLDVKIIDRKIFTDLHIKARDRPNISITHRHTLTILNGR